MAVGRFVCVALPIILLLGGIISFLVATLSGVTHQDLRLFTVDLSEIEIRDLIDLAGDALSDITDDIGGEAGDIINDVINGDTDIDQLLDSVGGDTGDLADNLGDGAGDLLDNLGDGAGDALDDILNNKRQTKRQTVGDLGLDFKFEITLWNYCTVTPSNRTCTDAQFNWANKQINLTEFEDLGASFGINIEIPDAVMNALRLFRTVVMWAEIAFIVALSVLTLELVIGIFSNFSRGISCLTWAIALVANVFALVAAGLATGTAVIVVGAIEASESLFGAQANLDTNFLIAIWIGAGLAVAAGFFWIFTICCCKPESRRNRRDKYADDNEKLFGAAPTSYAPLGNDNPYALGTARDFSHHDHSDHQSNSHHDSLNDTQSYAGGTTRTGYTPVVDQHEMTSGNYYNHNQPQFDPTYTPSQYAPTVSRSEAAYEPYTARH